MKLICIGRNYAKHIEELDNERPEHPVVFIKPDSSILLNKHPFVIPPFSNDIHHEVEILVKINKVGKYIDQKFAHTYYKEIGLGIDFTARDLQSQLKAKGLPWEKAKSFDGAAVVSNTWLAAASFKSVDNIPFRLDCNGETVQHGSTSQMLWKIDAIISYVSQYFTLKIGDVIFTGTPEGVARVKENDKLKGYIGEQEMFSVNVK